MADAVATKVLYAGTKRYIVSFSNLSDGTGESAVTKVDISGLTGAPTTVGVTRIRYSCQGMSAHLLFDKDATNELIAVCGGGDMLDFSQIGGVHPTTAAGKNDILITTFGHAAGDTYFVVLELTVA